MDVGVIGVGTMGRNHVRVYSEMKSVDTVGVYDVNGPAAKDIGEAARCRGVRHDERTARPFRCRERLCAHAVPRGNRSAGLLRKKIRAHRKADLRNCSRKLSG